MMNENGICSKGKNFPKGCQRLNLFVTNECYGPQQLHTMVGYGKNGIKGPLLSSNCIMGDIHVFCTFCSLEGINLFLKVVPPNDN